MASRRTAQILEVFGKRDGGHEFRRSGSMIEDGLGRPAPSFLAVERNMNVAGARGRSCRWARPGDAVGIEMQVVCRGRDMRRSAPAEQIVTRGAGVKSPLKKEIDFRCWARLRERQHPQAPTIHAKKQGERRSREVMMTFFDRYRSSPRVSDGRGRSFTSPVAVASVAQRV